MDPTPASAPPPSGIPPFPTETLADLRGVRGWLLVLCVSMTILTPLLSIRAIATSYSTVASLFAAYPGVRIVTFLHIALSTVLIAFSVFAGYRLATVRPGAVKLAKAFLVFTLAYTAVVSVLPFFAGLPSEANRAMAAEVAIGAARALLYFAVWFSYLSVSKRVKATYAS